jgi:stage IV sporulation protein B
MRAKKATVTSVTQTASGPVDGEKPTYGRTERGVRVSIAFLNIALLVLAGFILLFNYTLPDNYYVTGYEAGYENNAGIGNLPEFVSLHKGYNRFTTGGAAPALTISSDGRQVETASLKLFGVVPIKNITITDVGTPMLIPSGEPFGIKMLTDGVMVVDVNGFETEKGYGSPAGKAGLKPGDIIKTIAGDYVWSNNDVEEIIADSGGETVNVVYYRDGKLEQADVKPARAADGVYKIGMWVRDSSAGIGTMTFFDASTGRFAGLGHPVCDSTSGALLPLYSGEAVDVSVDGVIKGRSGSPGELTGTFLAGTKIGKLLVNSYAGVYGELSKDIIEKEENIQKLSAIPLGTRQQISEGDAYIFSTVEGELPQMYKIRIESVNEAAGADGKDMVIRVDDEKLIKKTGGIVQGMSGSPIIQNGRLIGAVTHVFVNNPLKGYAIFADTMYDTETGFDKE